MSVFLSIPEDKWVAQNTHAFAIRDAYPVTEGHTLVITKLVVASWFDASSEQKLDILELIDVVKGQLEKELQITAFNIGINVGKAAGQTVDHLHVHVIPRSSGDVSDPRGGVRNVIPSKGNYLDQTPELITPKASSFRKVLLEHLRDAELDRVDLIVAFVMRSGLQLIRESLEAAVQRGAIVRILTTDYLMTTDPSALNMLLDVQEAGTIGSNLELRVFSDHSTSFHPKAYLFRSTESNRHLALVGSSNLSKTALMHGIEWNLYRRDVHELWAEFESLWSDPRSVAINREWVREYSAKRELARAKKEDSHDDLVANEVSETAPQPWSVQREALDALELTRIDQHRAGLVVMATGLGKTWLAAFDSSRPAFKRILFVAHRVEILKAARDVFRRVSPSDHMTLFVGDSKDTSGKVVFAGVQLLQQNLDLFGHNDFDYIVVDEFHHATAPTYREVLNHFEPRFLLGLTATPERSDNADLLALCGDNLVYECGLVQGLQRNLLAPFKYRAIKDTVDYEHIPWKSGRFVIEELTTNLATQERAQQVLGEWIALDGPNRRTIAFCCSQAHADFMRDYFRERGYHCSSVHSGATSDPRSEALADLEAGVLSILFSVDLFNEGVDVPSIDCVLMLRPTESSVVFFQQLGRGLRKAADKHHLDVLDLVGNHHSFLAKARLLAQLGGIDQVKGREPVTFLEEKVFDLPAGCSIIVDVEAIDLLKSLASKAGYGAVVRQQLREWLSGHDSARPTALQFALYRGKEIGSNRRGGGWFGLLNSENALSPSEKEILQKFDEWLLYLEFGSYSKSFKLVSIAAYCQLGGFEKPVNFTEFLAACRKRLFGDPRLLFDLEDATSQFADVLNPTDVEWERYWTKNPIAALTRVQEGSHVWFELQGDQLAFSSTNESRLASVLSEMTLEMCEYRLHRYLVGKKPAKMFPRLTAVADDGELIDAGFHVESQFGQPTAIFIEASGGDLNKQYRAGADLMLRRLAQVGVRLMDAFVDSNVVHKKELPLAERRIVEIPDAGFIELQAVDVSKLLSDMLKVMKVVGKDAVANKGGGNSRKAMRWMIEMETSMTVTELADFLVSGQMPTSVSEFIA